MFCFAKLVTLIRQHDNTSTHQHNHKGTKRFWTVRWIY